MSKQRFDNFCQEHFQCVSYLCSCKESAHWVRWINALHWQSSCSCSGYQVLVADRRGRPTGPTTTIGPSPMTSVGRPCRHGGQGRRGPPSVIGGRPPRISWHVQPPPVVVMQGVVRGQWGGFTPVPWRGVRVMVPGWRGPRVTPKAIIVCPVSVPWAAPAAVPIGHRWGAPARNTQFNTCCCRLCNFAK